MPLTNYHRLVRHSQHHHRHHWIAFSLLVGGIAVLSLASADHPLDTLGFLRAFSGSFFIVVVAYILSLIIGVILGLATMASPKIEAVALPIVDLAQNLPTFAILPLMVYWFGQTPLVVITILVLAMIWPIIFSVVEGIKGQRQDIAEAATVFGATGWQRWTHYLWPWLRPQVIAGSVVSWGLAWETIVAAEIIAGVFGAGYYLGALGDGGNVQALALGVFIYMFLIFAINQLFWLPLLHRYSKYTARP